MTKYKVTWTKDDGREYTEIFTPTSEPASIEGVPDQFMRQITRNTKCKVLHVEELE